MLQDILTGGVGAGIVGGVFGLIQWILNRRAKIKDAKSVDCAARGAEIKAVRERVDDLAAAQIVNLHDRIKHLAKSYIERGWITVEELEDLERMHTVYKKLGGNGFLDELMRTVYALEKRAK